MKKKLLSVVVAVLMLVTILPTTALAATYNDTQGHWAESAIERWSEYSVLNGKDGNNFDPNASLTRAEAAQFFANLLQLETKGDISAFKDVPAGKWYYDAIAQCYAAGIINGTSATTMDPEGTITREMFFVMFARALGIQESSTESSTVKTAARSAENYSDFSNVSSWAQGYVKSLVDNGYVSGTTASTLSPTEPINRASTAALADKAIDTYVAEDNATVELTKSEDKTEENGEEESTAKIILIVGKNATVTGDASETPHIVSAASNSETTFKNVTNADSIVVAGSNSKADIESTETNNITVKGSSSDVTVKDTTTKNVSVDNKAEQAKVTLENTTADKVEVASKSTTVEATKSAIKEVAVTEKAEETKVTLTETTTDKVAVESKSTTVEANKSTVKEVAVAEKAEDTKVTLNETTTDKVAVESKSTTVEATKSTIKEVEVTEKAANTEITVDKNSKVETVTNASADTAVKGEGTVSKVETSEDVKIETSGTSVTNTNTEKDVTVTDSTGSSTNLDKTTENSSSNNNSQTTVNNTNTSAGSTSTPSTPSTPTVSHTHTYDEHGVCEGGDGYNYGHYVNIAESTDTVDSDNKLLLIAPGESFINAIDTRLGSLTGLTLTFVNGDDEITFNTTNDGNGLLTVKASDTTLTDAWTALTGVFTRGSSDSEGYTGISSSDVTLIFSDKSDVKSTTLDKLDTNAINNDFSNYEDWKVSIHVEQGDTISYGGVTVEFHTTANIEIDPDTFTEDMRKAIDVTNHSILMDAMFNAINGHAFTITITISE
jgi:hypothetical protein